MNRLETPILNELTDGIADSEDESFNIRQACSPRLLQVRHRVSPFGGFTPSISQAQRVSEGSTLAISTPTYSEAVVHNIVNNLQDMKRMQGITPNSLSAGAEEVVDDRPCDGETLVCDWARVRLEAHQTSVTDEAELDRFARDAELVGTPYFSWCHEGDRYRVTAIGELIRGRAP